MNRRRFLSGTGLTAAGALLTSSRTGAASSPARQYGGQDLSGWQVALGDGSIAAPEEPEVTLADIETLHHGTYSELRANLTARRILAHNITYTPVIDDAALHTIHRASYWVRLPFLACEVARGQTVEGGLFVWDGSDTRLDYGLAFQWLINPTTECGELRCWTDVGGGSWQAVGYLPPDMEWHQVSFVLDVQRETTALLIDGQHYPCAFTATAKPESWGDQTEARLQVEIISIDPGDEGSGALHTAEVRDWSWTWEPYVTSASFLPIVRIR